MEDNFGLKQENIMILIEFQLELGKQITLNRVLLLNNDGNILIGKPYYRKCKN